MKTKLFTLMFLMICGLSYGYDSYYETQYDYHQYLNTMDVVARVYIGDEAQNTDRYEVGVYNGDVVQGHGMLRLGLYPYYYAVIKAYGEGGEIMSFKLYDHQENVELDLVTSLTYVLEDGAEYGRPATPVDMHFYQAGAMTFTNAVDINWSTEGNWSPRIPTNADDAIIAANSICVIDEDATVAYKTLTIKDGAQFFAPVGSSYTATIEKEITGYTGTRDNYYFISSPVGNPFNFETVGMLSGNYDLYYFDQNGIEFETWTEIYEWQNYKDYQTWGLDFGAPFGGYLYANSEETTLSFTGVLFSESEKKYTNLKIGGANFSGFNLIGNPYSCNALVTTLIPVQMNGYYMINPATRSEVITVENPVVAPCTALFAVAKMENPNIGAKFTPTTSGSNVRNIESLISIEVSDIENLLDRAYVRFNEQENLQKFTLNPNAPHIFFREEGKDYAIVQGNERMSQLPLFFETREYGTYTINVKLENLTCEYLHLIDNLTGMDVDLLATPSYTFQANSSDYAARFKIVFEGTGVEENTANESFAIVEGNRVIIPAIEHESALEVIDMTGRTVSSQKVNGSFDQTLNVKAGIYMLRLNGMTQKIVIE